MALAGEAPRVETKQNVVVPSQPAKRRGSSEQRPTVRTQDIRAPTGVNSQGNKFYTAAASCAVTRKICAVGTNGKGGLAAALLRTEN
jgi:hypothetical protein